MIGRALAWLDDRTGWSDTPAGNVMVGTRAERTLQVVNVTLLLVLAITGALLALHYRPGVDDAHRSVVALSSRVPFGSLVRGIHQWASDALVLTSSLWLFTLVWRHRYKRGWELVWWTAVALWVVILEGAVTGAILPWSRDGLATASMAGGTAAMLPLVGEQLRGLTLGGEFVSDATLTRAYGFHVAVIPGVLACACAAYRRLRRCAERDEPTEPALTTSQTAAVAVATLCAVTLLATLWPRYVAPAGRLGEASEAAVPPWFMGGLHRALESAPVVFGVESARVVLAVSTLFTLLTLALPWLAPRGSRIVRYGASAFALALLGWTLYAL